MAKGRSCSFTVALEAQMSSIVKVIEVIAESDRSFDDAVRNAVQEASRTVSGIKTVWVENLSATVDGSQITKFRANCKVSFLVEGRA